MRIIPDLAASYFHNILYTALKKTYIWSVSESSLLSDYSNEVLTDGHKWKRACLPMEHFPEFGKEIRYLLR